MCTVTFVPTAEHFFITHNRDEKNARLRALPPGLASVNGHQVLYPRDQKAGGSWIAMNENGNAAVLLNGAFKKHIPASSYKKSRGLVFLDIVASADMLSAWKSIDLDNIEPFTIVFFNDRHLCEAKWDGIRKHIATLNEKEAHIWASVTLYDETAQSKRKAWFDEWAKHHPQPSMEDIIDFHLFAGEGDQHNDLRINRDGHILTVSVTTIKISTQAGVMRYVDFEDDSTHQQEINFLTDAVERQ